MGSQGSTARLTYMVKQLELAIRYDMEAIAGQFGVTALQYTALSVLARDPGMSSAQFTRRSFVSAQAGHEMITILERKRLISRSPNANNKRILSIKLTAKGRKLLAECDLEVDGLERRMLEHLDRAEVHKFRGMLSSCTSTLRQQRHDNDSLDGQTVDHM